MDRIFLRQDYRAKRVSSFDVTGGNQDSKTVQPHDRADLANLTGPGVIRHIWFTMFGRWGPDDVREFDPLSLRKVVLRMYWDGEQDPSVECPVGDFFGLGHSRAFTYQCAAFSTSCNPAVEGEINGRVAMNCWLPMPFHQKARLEIENQQDIPVTFYYYIDYQEHSFLSAEAHYLHAWWRRENPCKGIKDGDGRNLSDRDNYLILEAEGEGHYIGFNLSINNLEGGWWGEGDDMIFVDRDQTGVWPPDLHGTGTEDYLCHAWGMQRVSHLFSGQPWCEEKGLGYEHHFKGKVCAYRYHLLDPVPFQYRIRVSMEHGHANDRSDDIASVAYWYQMEPHRRFPPLAQAAERLVR